MGATTVLVDGGIIMRVCINEVGLGAEFFKNTVADDAGGAVGTVDADFEI